MTAMFRRTKKRLRDIGTEPDYRFSLANERTFLAYLRTALGLFVAGIAVLELVDISGSSAYDTLLGVSLLALGILTSATSYRRWRAAEEAMRRASPLPYSPVPRLLAAALTGVTVATVVAVLLR